MIGVLECQARVGVGRAACAGVANEDKFAFWKVLEKSFQVVVSRTAEILHWRGLVAGSLTSGQKRLGEGIDRFD